MPKKLLETIEALASGKLAEERRWHIYGQKVLLLRSKEYSIHLYRGLSERLAASILLPTSLSNLSGDALAAEGLINSGATSHIDAISQEPELRKPGWARYVVYAYLL
jgi:hypothetical protein